jgi:predicted naringenin-chalcone synthase
VAKIISIATKVPQYRHTQQQLLAFMDGAYGAGDKERRILSYLYKHSGINTRYSVIPDYTAPMSEWQFYPKSRNLEPFPNLEYRMEWYHRHALPLSVASSRACLQGLADRAEITHLITVSCTGMSAPGLELQLMEALQLPAHTNRTAINFMGCYAAVHGLKMANDIVTAQPAAKVLVVCTELCTLHFQKTFSEDAITAPLLFADGSAAALVVADSHAAPGLALTSFYSEVLKDEKDSMTWNLSSSGFVMTLSAEVPEIFKADIGGMMQRALAHAGLGRDAVRHYSIHPGGKRILQAIGTGLGITDEDMAASYTILRDYGNMSSATLLFVLQEQWPAIKGQKGEHIFAAAFGPGLTMESIILTVA